MEVAIRENVPLAPLTTLALGGPARWFAEVASASELGDALAWARARGVAVRVLGGGSNLVVGDAGLDALVVRLRFQAVDVERGSEVHVRVGAGVPWSDVVERAVRERWAGLECLAGIPGLTGAVPIQNVGAYGQEVSETISAVGVMSPDGVVRDLAPDACGFAYRDSAFKRREHGLGEVIVTSVTFTLRPGDEARVRYTELARALGVREGDRVPLVRAYDTVLALRRGKSMVLDPNDENRRSAGSFFTNPIVSDAEADGLAARAVANGWARDAAAIPRFAAGAGRAKIAAAWLIERAGFAKGERRGAFGISSRHALALVHHGGGHTADLLAFADEIAARVRAVTGIALQREPIVW